MCRQKFRPHTILKGAHEPYVNALLLKEVFRCQRQTESTTRPAAIVVKTPSSASISCCCAVKIGVKKGNYMSINTCHNKHLLQVLASPRRSLDRNRQNEASTETKKIKYRELSKCAVSHFNTTSLENPQIMFRSIFLLCVCARVHPSPIQYFTVLTSVPWGGEKGFFSDES